MICLHRATDSKVKASFIHAVVVLFNSANSTTDVSRSGRPKVPFPQRETERQTETERDRYRERQRQKETDTDRQTDRHTE